MRNNTNTKSVGIWSDRGAVKVQKSVGIWSDRSKGVAKSVGIWSD
jgi:hypothetical protein